MALPPHPRGVVPLLHTAAPATYSYPSNAFDTWHDIDARYVKFTFRSDSSTHRDGWDISLASSTYVAGEPIPTLLPSSIGQKLYLDSSTYDKVTETVGDGFSLGFIAGLDASNNSIYMKTAYSNF